MSSIALDVRDTMLRIPKLEPQENIVNDLGVRVDNNGNYYEGTWKNNKLIYGLMYKADQNAYYVGRISYDENTDGGAT